VASAVASVVQVHFELFIMRGFQDGEREQGKQRHERWSYLWHFLFVLEEMKLKMCLSKQPSAKKKKHQKSNFGKEE
jgi:hypothetical protein